ncbi:MAG: translesion error-prone DNA polymerase V autoproteolytic subunit, partial [candidate division Zixibacteria bacterium]|nr:translesion error-prone DNA polymerase V autoproteolytic subunit [candidate division Zixibacteria bacterium]
MSVRVTDIREPRRDRRSEQELEGSQAPQASQASQASQAPPTNACTGFPSPAADYIERSLDLNEHLISRPAATFFMRASGDSLRDDGVRDGSLLIVDRSLTPLHNQIVVATLNGELVVKRVALKGNTVALTDRDSRSVTLASDTDAEIWGVV